MAKVNETRLREGAGAMPVDCYGNKLLLPVVFMSCEAASGRIHVTFDLASAPCNIEVG